MQDFTEFTEAGFGSLLQRLEAGGYRFARSANVLPFVTFYGATTSQCTEPPGWPRLKPSAESLRPTSSTRAQYSTISLESKIEVLLRRIRSLGHKIGLHFDAGAYSTATWTSDSLELMLRREQSFVENLLESSIKVVRWHNTDQSNLLDFDAVEIAGMLNVYAGRLRRDYAYCSDSNGYWRFQAHGSGHPRGHDRLHLLTHPEWWTPETMSPPERINRAILGRT